MAYSCRNKTLVMLYIGQLIQIAVFSPIQIYVCRLRHSRQRFDEKAEKPWQRVYLRTASESVDRKARELRGSLDLS